MLDGLRGPGDDGLPWRIVIREHQRRIERLHQLLYFLRRRAQGYHATAVGQCQSRHSLSPQGSYPNGCERVPEARRGQGTDFAEAVTDGKVRFQAEELQHLQRRHGGQHNGRLGYARLAQVVFPGGAGRLICREPVFEDMTLQRVAGQSFLP